jgi:uncharacterized membrane protein
MTFFSVWIASIILTCFIANEKKYSVIGFFFLALITGPLAVIIILLVSPKKLVDANDVQSKINQLSTELSLLKARVFELEELINGKNISIPLINSKEVPTLSKAAEPLFVVAPKRGDEPISIPVEKPKVDLEMILGRDWLNKIGIVVFALGIGFLISYTFKYFAPIYKIMFGYAVSFGLMFLGMKLERHAKLENFGKVLIGGGWALVYFTTYAMHHFAGSRVIDSQLIDLCLLFVVTIGMMLHVMKYKSETIMSMALFVAYVTTTLGQITVFTAISTSFLGLAVLYLFYQFQWVKTFILGMILTYTIHYFWVLPKISVVDQSWFNLLFLTAYWAIFFLGTHLVRIKRDELTTNMLAAANFINILLYSYMSYQIIDVLFEPYKAFIFTSVGLIYLLCAFWMKKNAEEKLYISDLVASLLVLTFAIMLQFKLSTSVLLWFIEIPLLIYIGINTKEAILRFFAYGLTMYAGASLMIAPMPQAEREILALLAALSMAISFGMTRGVLHKNDARAEDLFFDKVFPTLSFIYLNWFLFAKIKMPWICPVLSLEALLLVMLSVHLNIKRLRGYAYAALSLLAVCFMLNDIFGLSTLKHWTIILTNVGIFFAIYVLLKHYVAQNKLVMFFIHEAAAVLVGGTLMLMFAIYQHVPHQWISLALGTSGVGLIAMGIMARDKIERSLGLVLLGLTFVRVIMVDLSGLDIIFKIISFITIGLLFLGISFIYNRFTQDK